MMRYQVMPLIYDEFGNPNIPPVVLDAVWAQLEAEDKVRHVFYGGSVHDLLTWRQFLSTPTNYPVFVLDMDQAKLVFLAWMNHLANGTAQIHFTSIGKYRRGTVEVVLDYWRSFKMPDGEQMFCVLLGMTPETNVAALKLSRLTGFTRLEPTIPEACILAYEGNRRVGGVVTFLKL